MTRIQRRTAKWPCWLLVGGLVLAVLALIAALAVPWLVKMQDYRETAEEMVQRIARYQQLLSSREMYQQQLQQLSILAQQSNFFVEAESPELAAAELQRRIKKAIEKAGGQLVSTQNLPVDQTDGPRKVEIKLRMKGDVVALARIMFLLERSKPVFKIKDLVVRSRRMVKRQGRKRVESYVLDVSFRVQGYMMEKTS